MLNFYNGYTRNQRYQSWKSGTMFQIQPKTQAPLANNSALEDPTGNANNIFPARRPGPIKHHRLRGSTQALGSSSDCSKCNGKLSVMGPNKVSTRCSCANDGKPLRIKSASTMLGSTTENGLRVPKTYASSNREYLQRRCKTFNQRQFNYASSSVNGANNEYLANCDCSQQPGSCTTATCRRVIYKRNNTGFATQGAVDSSARLHKLKQNAISDNKCCMKANGNSAHIKSITNNCDKRTYVRVGHRRVCR